jgi:hypothetical protein
MDKKRRLIYLLLIFMPLLFLALMAGFMGLLFFEIRRWKFLLC